MFKIKLLILLLINLTLSSCIKDNSNNIKNKYSVGHISGEYDGLILKNTLINHLSSVGLYDDNSTHKIKSSIKHSSKLYITNIDNTSDRLRVSSELSINIVNQKFKCVTYRFDERISQYYIYADSDKYISNNKAEKKIKEENTNALVKEFINKLEKPKSICRNINE